MILRETLASNFSGGADVDISGDCKYISIAYSSGVSAFEGDGYSYNLTEVLNESQNSSILLFYEYCPARKIKMSVFLESILSNSLFHFSFLLFYLFEKFKSRNWSIYISGKMHDFFFFKKKYLRRGIQLYRQRNLPIMNWKVIHNNLWEFEKNWDPLRI